MQLKIRNSSFIISIGLKVIPIWRVGNSMKLDYSNMIRLKLLRELKNGKYAKDVQVNITLKKPAVLNGEETGAALTYVHTYKDTTVTFMGYEMVGKIPVPLFRFGSSTAAWKDTISITGLLY